MSLKTVPSPVSPAISDRPKCVCTSSIAGSSQVSACQSTTCGHCDPSAIGVVPQRGTLSHPNTLPQGKERMDHSNASDGNSENSDDDVTDSDDEPEQARHGSLNGGSSESIMCTAADISSLPSSYTWVSFRHCLGKESSTIGDLGEPTNRWDASSRISFPETGYVKSVEDVTSESITEEKIILNSESRGIPIGAMIPSAGSQRPLSFKPAGTIKFGISNDNAQLRRLIGKGSISVASPMSYETARSALSSYKTAPLSTSTRSAIGSANGSDGTLHSPRAQEEPQKKPRKIKASEISKLVSKIISEARSYADLMLGIDWEPLKPYIMEELKSFASRGFCDPANALAERIADEIHQTSPFEESQERGQFESFVEEILDGFAKSHGVTHSTASMQVFSSEWLEFLRERGILSAKVDELDWSGRGQHVEYSDEEANEIPIHTEKVIGYSATALVESVMCRRIRLARKTIRWNRRLSKEDAIIEVEHLQRLRHSHIVRVVGTYTLKKNLAILLYPVAEWNLEEFMDDIVELDETTEQSRRLALVTFFGCLTRTIRFLHNENVKHMDIKPKNILVRHMGPKLHGDLTYKIYLADFGIARAYSTAADAETASPISYTRTYAAPEVVLQETRGFSADIFSLGCVFFEMFATLLSDKRQDRNQRQRLQAIRVDDLGDTSYQANILAVRAWFRHECKDPARSGVAVVNLLPLADFVEILPEMIAMSPGHRPVAWLIERVVQGIHCARCAEGSEPFEAARP